MPLFSCPEGTQVDTPWGKLGHLSSFLSWVWSRWSVGYVWVISGKTDLLLLGYPTKLEIWRLALEEPTKLESLDMAPDVKRPASVSQTNTEASARVSGIGTRNVRRWCVVESRTSLIWSVYRAGQNRSFCLRGQSRWKRDCTGTDGNTSCRISSTSYGFIIHLSTTLEPTSLTWACTSSSNPTTSCCMGTWRRRDTGGIEPWPMSRTSITCTWTTRNLYLDRTLPTLFNTPTCCACISS